MPMPHRTFAQLAKRRLVGKEGRERIREVRVEVLALIARIVPAFSLRRRWAL
jgi:hypothetical protein